MVCTISRRAAPFSPYLLPQEPGAFQIRGKKDSTTEDTENTEEEKVNKRKAVSGPPVFSLWQILGALCESAKRFRNKGDREMRLYRLFPLFSSRISVSSVLSVVKKIAPDLEYASENPARYNLRAAGLYNRSRETN
jgi:hypothetical protein